jgi:hypothetical protein
MTFSRRRENLAASATTAGSLARIAATVPTGGILAARDQSAIGRAEMSGMAVNFARLPELLKQR